MRWIHLITVIVLTGTLFGIRILVLPSLRVLTPDNATLFMGKLMPRVRRALRLGVFLLVATEVYLFASRSSSDLHSWHPVAELALTLAVSLLVLVLCVSPHRRLALKVELRRTQLLDISLALLIALTAVTHLE